MTDKIVGYRFKRDVLCGTDMKKALPTGPDEAFDGWADATGKMGAEEFLDGIAQAFGIDRATFTNADLFPIPVRDLDTVEGIPACDKCGEILL